MSAVNENWPASPHRLMAVAFADTIATTTTRLLFATFRFFNPGNFSGVSGTKVVSYHTTRIWVTFIDHNDFTDWPGFCDRESSPVWSAHVWPNVPQIPIERNNLLCFSTRFCDAYQVSVTVDHKDKRELE